MTLRERVAPLLGVIVTQAVGFMLAIGVVSTGAGQDMPRTSQLVIAQLGNPSALDGWNWTATSEQDILAHVQESLLQYDREARLQPLLAESLVMAAIWPTICTTSGSSKSRRGRGAVYTKDPDHWDTWSQEISRMGLQDLRRQDLLYELQAEIMGHAPWVLVPNFQDIYALSNHVDWKSFSNERRGLDHDVDHPSS